MALGQKMGSLKALKKSMAKGSGGAFIKYIPKNGSMNVRFIQEPEEWVNYAEHYDQIMRKSYPCNGESNCPGCLSQERKSSRYLANVVDRDDKDRVIPLQLPKDLANRLVAKYERQGTLTDRDYELSRSGEGLDTVYDADAGVVDRAKIDKFQPHDLLKVLQDAYDNVFGGDDSDDEEDEAPAKSGARTGGVKARKKTAAAKAVEDDEDVDDEEDEEEEPAPKPAAKKAAKKAPAKKAAAKAPEPEFEPDEDEDPEDEEEEPEDEVEETEADDDEDGEEGYSEEELRAMPLGALRTVAREEFGVSTRGKDQDALIDAIFGASEDEDA